ncbi:MAG: hypothetical protein HKP53_09705 [Eudoraea sp.]|nr:hypothetical protein [Eudoraea sp.]
MALLKGFIVIVLVLLSNEMTAQDVHQITLLVDTKNKVPEKAYTFSAGNNTTVLNSSAPNSFTIFARVGDQIKWKAASSSEPDVPVIIKQIKYLSGPRIFSSDLIQGKPTSQATVIRGGNEKYTYQLQIAIDSEPKVYTIPAKIQIGN